VEETTLARQMGKKLKQQADKKQTTFSYCGQCKRLLWRQRLFLNVANCRTAVTAYCEFPKDHFVIR
jgi:uncharacterized protein with PIN domain